MKLLMIDNYDSFTFNIVQYFGELGAEVTTLRNDEVTLDELQAMFQRGEFARLCISPGPCSPAEAGVSVAAIRHFAGKLPILGVCLGHQAIGAAFGGRIVRARELMHGKTSLVSHEGGSVLEGLPSPFTATRYHSLAVEEATVPAELEITARTDSGVVMALRHRELPIEGVQFHPESVLTEHGYQLLANWLVSCGDPQARERSVGLEPVVTHA